MKDVLRFLIVPVFLFALSVFALATPAVAQLPLETQPPLEPLDVHLDDTGVSIKYVNSLDPVELQAGPDGRDQPIRFFNTTGDRTFVVTMPFVYSAVEAGSAYAVADEERGGQVVSEIVCRTLEQNGGGACTTEEIRAVDAREGLRVLYEAAASAKDTSLAGQCGPDLKESGCLVETLFWRAACGLGDRQALVKFARNPETSIERKALVYALGKEAGELVKELLGERTTPVPCSFVSIKDLQERIDEELTVIPDPRPSIDPVAAQAKSEGLKKRFAAERAALAKTAIQTAISARMDTNDLQIQPLLDRLENLRKSLQRQEAVRQADRERECRLRELEAAAKLLNSYSVTSQVPYTGLPETLISDKTCQGEYSTPGLESTRTMETKGDREQMMRAVRQALIQARGMRVERATEQGVDITDCKAEAAATTCVATATIPPYQFATFSPSILAHQLKKRIAFTVAFFGETEVPANATGYVIRPLASAADKRPDKTFTLSFGGDASSSMDPDKAIGGLLRHSGSSGTLSFLFAGAVEASATLRFKQGDFGGAADTNKIEASQYQGKVFGHKLKRLEEFPLLGLLKDQAISLQYGRLQFAKPSSGIGVNVFGEGVQLAVGPSSFSHVVLRESDDLKAAADTENDDSDLWIFQVKNVPLRIPGLRSFEFVGLKGQDRKDEEAEELDDPTTTLLPIPFDYWSVGGEVRWGGIPTFGGSISAYYSERDVKALPPPGGDRPFRLPGQGWTVLGRASWNPFDPPKLNEPKKTKPQRKFGVSLLVGYGTGDDKKTEDEDEGYLGENAGFSNDMIFLSRVSKAFPKEIGIGLANKWYGGLQLTDPQADWLKTIPRILGVSDDEIASTSTIVSLHTYSFVREVEGLHWGGAEADVELNVEAPKNIRWSLSGAYYPKTEVLKAIGRVQEDPIDLDRGLWSATAKLTIGLSYP